MRLAGLNLTWSKIPDDTFSHDAAHIRVNFLIFSWPILPSAQVPVYRIGNMVAKTILDTF